VFTSVSDIYVHHHVYIYVYVYVYTYVWIYIYTCTYLLIHICTHLFACTNTHKLNHTHLHIRTNEHAQASSRTQTHTYSFSIFRLLSLIDTRYRGRSRLHNPRITSSMESRHTVEWCACWWRSWACCLIASSARVASLHHVLLQACAHAHKYTRTHNKPRTPTSSPTHARTHTHTYTHTYTHTDELVSWGFASLHDIRVPIFCLFLLLLQAAPFLSSGSGFMYILYKPKKHYIYADNTGTNFGHTHKHT